MKKFIIAVVVVGLMAIVGTMVYIATLSKQEIVEYDPSTVEVSTGPVEKWQEGTISYNGKQFKILDTDSLLKLINK